VAPGEMLTHRPNGSTGEKGTQHRRDRQALLGRSFGSRRAMVDLRTSASMIADKVKPRISDQVTC
jgi:hypothetical protein